LVGSLRAMLSQPGLHGAGGGAAGPELSNEMLGLRDRIGDLAKRYQSLVQTARGFGATTERLHRELGQLVDRMTSREEADLMEQCIVAALPATYYELLPTHVEALSRPEFSAKKLYEAKMKAKLEKETRELCTSGKLFEVLDKTTEAKLLDLLLERKIKREASDKSRPPIDSPSSHAVDALAGMSTFAAKFGSSTGKAIKRSVSALSADDRNSYSSVDGAARRSSGHSNGGGGSNSHSSSHTSISRDAKKVARRDSGAPQLIKVTDNMSDKRASSGAPHKPYLYSTRQLLESAPYFRQRVARELAEHYLEEKDAPRYMTAKFPFINALEVPQAWTRFTKGMEGAGNVVSTYAGWVVDQILLREVNSEREKFDMLFPTYENSVLLTKNKFPENDSDIYNESQAYQTMCRQTADIAPHYRKVIFSHIDNFPLTDDMFSSERSSRLDLDANELNKLRSAKTFGDIVELLKRETAV